VIASDVSGEHRNTGFLDAGVCSKTVRALPAMSRFFKGLRNTLGGMQNQTTANTGAVRNLQQTQADFNNETNLLNYWMRQVSPQMDKLNIELRQGNDALAGMQAAQGGTSSSDAPGIPDALMLLPSMAVGKLMLYFVRPSYTGTTPISDYEYCSFGTSALAQANDAATTVVSVTKDDAAAKGDYIVDGADDMYAMYGTDLCVIEDLDPAALLPVTTYTAMAIRIRAKNGGGLVGAWSAPTMQVTPATALDLKPVVLDVVPGVGQSLVSWRVPRVNHPAPPPSPPLFGGAGDLGGYAYVAGIHSYTISTGPALPTNSVLADCGTLVVNGSTSVAQLPLVGTVPAGDLAVTVTANVGAAIHTSTGPLDTIPISQASDRFVLVGGIPLKVPAPRLSVQVRGLVAYVNATIPDYYIYETMTYTITATNMTTGATIGATIISTAPDADGTATTASTTMTLAPGQSYSFSAYATHPAADLLDVGGTDSTPVGPYFASALAPVPPSRPTAVTAAGGAGFADVTFSSSNDLSPLVTQFKVTADGSTGMVTSPLFPAASSPFTYRIMGLTAGTVYTITVTAIGSGGQATSFTPATVTGPITATIPTIAYSSPASGSSGAVPLYFSVTMSSGVTGAAGTVYANVSLNGATATTVYSSALVGTSEYRFPSSALATPGNYSMSFGGFSSTTGTTAAVSFTITAASLTIDQLGVPFTPSGYTSNYTSTPISSSPLGYATIGLSLSSSAFTGPLTATLINGVVSITQTATPVAGLVEFLPGSWSAALSTLGHSTSTLTVIDGSGTALAGSAGQSIAGLNSFSFWF